MRQRPYDRKGQEIGRPEPPRRQALQIGRGQRVEKQQRDGDLEDEVRQAVADGSGQQARPRRDSRGRSGRRSRRRWRASRARRLLRLPAAVAQGFRAGGFCHRGRAGESVPAGRPHRAGKGPMARTILITGCSTGIGRCAALGMRDAAGASSPPPAGRRTSPRSRPTGRIPLPRLRGAGFDRRRRRCSARRHRRRARRALQQRRLCPARRAGGRFAPTCCAPSSRRISSAGTI